MQSDLKDKFQRSAGVFVLLLSLLALVYSLTFTRERLVRESKQVAQPTASSEVISF